MNIDFSTGHWINPPQRYRVTSDEVEWETEPGTDFWQRSYYGFSNSNAPALLVESSDNFTFTCKAAFDYQRQFDQCGVIIYIDSENWFKASIEFEHAGLSRLGSVVTNLGYSDWATTDIDTRSCMWYRLSRRGPDFLIEGSTDGHTFGQMRIFHMHMLGETTLEMGRRNPPLTAEGSVTFGLYACSPNASAFTARFSNFTMEDCRWLAHGTVL